MPHGIDAEEAARKSGRLPERISAPTVNAVHPVIPVFVSGGMGLPRCFGGAGGSGASPSNCLGGHVFLRARQRGAIHVTARPKLGRAL